MTTYMLLEVLTPYIGLILLAITAGGASYIWYAARQVSTSAAPTASWFVGEVWLDWTICRGSTMFRCAAPTEEQALQLAHRHAKLLDDLLPTSYMAQNAALDWYPESYDYSIEVGVRSISLGELENGVSHVWSTVLPGTRGAKEETSEHWFAHPLNRPLNGDLEGFKV